MSQERRDDRLAEQSADERRLASTIGRIFATMLPLAVAIIVVTIAVITAVLWLLVRLLTSWTDFTF